MLCCSQIMVFWNERKKKFWKKMWKLDILLEKIVWIKKMNKEIQKCCQLLELSIIPFPGNAGMQRELTNNYKGLLLHGCYFFWITCKLNALQIRIQRHWAFLWLGAGIYNQFKQSLHSAFVLIFFLKDGLKWHKEVHISIQISICKLIIDSCSAWKVHQA